MKKYILFASLLAASLNASAAQWAPVKDALLTPWGEKVTPENVWQEYPRPQMVRSEWQNLNGLWQFSTAPASEQKPSQWQQTILVPFAMETPLSGVGQRLSPGHAIWYQRTFESNRINTHRTLLNFEGVDYFCTVWLNGQEIGTHKGGNLPFSFDVTSALKQGSNELLLKVLDDTDKPGTYQLRGKQKVNNGGIWYSPSSGIWNTVWLEQVPLHYLADLKLSGDMNGQLNLSATVAGDPLATSLIRVSVLENDKLLAQKTSLASGINLTLNQAQLWSPKSPKLYDLKVELLNADGKTLDTVDSYVGFRSVAKHKDVQGHWRFTLNGQEIFHWGPLDQGWWPDGFLMPPSDQAIVFEMDYLKKAGFNMIRKHKKVEPRRYYYHADQLGFLVWQDQVSGGAGGNEWPKWKRLEMISKDYKPDPSKKGWWQGESDPINAIWPDWAHEQYMLELKTMIDTLYNSPGVVVWTTFNERWGQHRSLEVGQWVAQYDPSRHLNIASGGNFFPVGDIADQHQYPDPGYPFNVPLYDDYIKVVGEFGGHGWPVEGHLWKSNKKKFVYGGMPKDMDEYKQRYIQSIEVLGHLKTQGVAAGVYTQTTDVEIEINGLLTYDRKVNKIAAEELAEITRKNQLID